jgi:flavorubredoxin
MKTHVTNRESGTNVCEIAPNLFRISTPVPPAALPGGFTFNQFLVVDDAPLLFHTGYRKMFPLVREALAHILGDVTRLRYVGFSHFEADECGSLNDWLAIAPQAVPVCGTVAAMVSVNDIADRAPRALSDGEELSLGSRSVRWLDAPHVPHNWECGYMFDTGSRTLLCGDLLTHLGHDVSPLTDSDVVGRALAAHEVGMDGMGTDKHIRSVLEKLARTEPTTLALMHGSSYRGNGGKQLLALADALTANT